MGKKYISELEDNESVYKTIIANGYPMIQVIVPAPYTEPDMEQVRKEAYEKGYETAKHECDDCSKQAYTDTLRMDVYRKGLSDAWEAARKVTYASKYGGYGDCLDKVFNRHDGEAWDVFDYSATEALEKIRAYEQAQKEKEEQIQVGDEVIPSYTIADPNPAIVTRKWKDNEERDFVDTIGFNGNTLSFLESHVDKTGRHFPEIAEVLQKMKES